MARKRDDNPIIVSQRSAQLMAEYIHQGPLPAPMDFAAYGDVLPDAPERILAMAEKEQEHRHQKDNEQIQILKYRITGSLMKKLGMKLSIILDTFNSNKFQAAMLRLS